MPNPSEFERLSDSQPTVPIQSTDGTDLERCRVEPVPMRHARVDRRTGLPIPAAEHPAERAAREYAEAATVGGEAALRRRIAELEAELASARATNRELHRRAQQAESTESGRSKPLHKEIADHRRSLRFAREWFDAHGMDWFFSCNEASRRLVEILLAEKRAAEARTAGLEALAAKLSDRLAACSECLGRAAERRPAYEPPTVDEIREYEGAAD